MRFPCWRFHVTHYQFISGFFSSHFPVYDAMSPSLHNIMVLYVAQVCCPTHSFRSSRSVYFKFRILRLYEHFPVLKLPFCRARDSLLGTKPLKGWRGAWIPGLCWKYLSADLVTRLLWPFNTCLYCITRVLHVITRVYHVFSCVCTRPACTVVKNSDMSMFEKSSRKVGKTTYL